MALRSAEYSGLPVRLTAMGRYSALLWSVVPTGVLPSAEVSGGPLPRARQGGLRGGRCDDSDIPLTDARIARDDVTMPAEPAADEGTPQPPEAARPAGSPHDLRALTPPAGNARPATVCDGLDWIAGQLGATIPGQVHPRRGHHHGNGGPSRGGPGQGPGAAPQRRYPSVMGGSDVGD